MAEFIIDDNLNIAGNKGRFESDRSVWGFGDTADFEATRSTEQKFDFNYSCKLKALSNSALLSYASAYIPAGKFKAEYGKRYIAIARVYVPTATPPSQDTAKITFRELSGGSPASMIQFTDVTVLEAKDTWVEITAKFYHDDPLNTTVNQILSIGLSNSGAAETLIADGILFIDKFDIFQYKIIADEPGGLVCDLEINVIGSTIVNESAPGANDGSIDVAVIGTGTYEFSKDNGATWQPSNQFLGLGSGIYQVHVRDTTEAECLAEHAFVVNSGATAFDFTLAVVNETVSGSQNGMISATVTGTGGPFEFSIDYGATWQGSNTFSDLAAGTYDIAVKDSNDNIIVKSATVAAGVLEVDKVVHSKNPIIFQKAASSIWQSLTNYRLYNDVRVEEVADSGNYVSKLKFELVPDSTGQAIFYIREAFRGVFTFTLPTLNDAAIIRLTDRIKRYKNYYGSLVNTEVTPATIFATVASLCVFGGIDKFNYPNLNYFTSYIATNKKFLTWAPIEKYVARTQEDYLNFWVYGDFTTIQLQVKAYYDDATTETEVVVTKTGCKYGHLYQVPSGPANSGALLINPSKNLVKYEVSLLNQIDALITEVRTYVVEKVTHPRTRLLMFLNSLGTWEVIRFTGVTSEDTDAQSEVIQKFLPHDYDPLDGEFMVNTGTLTTKITYSSGYIANRYAKEWHVYLKDLMLPKTLIYDVTTGHRVPLIITGAKYSRQDQNYERFVQLEARPAYDDESFTPVI